MGKSEFIKDASIRILSALLIEDRIAWYKDIECFGNSNADLIDTAVNSAEILWEKLKEKGYCQDSQQNSIE